MLRRFFVEEIKEDNGFCSITGSEAKHISMVLRMERGDRFILVDGKGHRFQVTITSVTPKTVRVVLEKKLAEPPQSPVKITLCPALPKSRAMDYVVQKTTELGADYIVPFFSERTVVKYNKERLVNKMRHWREISVSSSKQCGGIPARIEFPASFRELIEKWKEEDSLKVVLWEDEGANDLKGVLKSYPTAKNFVGLVGPEGGFTREEVNALRDVGFIPVFLGHRVLRAETAAIVMVAIVQYELGDLCLNPI